MVVHLLHEFPRELDRLNVGSERTPEDAFEEALDLRFDGAQDSHERESRTSVVVVSGSTGAVCCAVQT